MTSTARRTLAVLGALALAGTLGACGVVTEGLGRDAGPRATETRDVSDVSRVVLSTSGTMDLTIGEPSLTITAGENVLESLETEISGDTLEISLPRWFNPGPIHYDLTLPSLAEIDLRGSATIEGAIAGAAYTELAVSGSGEIWIDEIDADDVEVTVTGSGDVVVDELTADDVQAEISGSGSIELSGRTGTLGFRVPGSGELHAADLHAVDASVEISGSGSARVHVTGALDVRISGSGDVRHSGGAQVTRSVSGSGSVEEA